MFTYKLTKVSQLGDSDPKYGTRFWAEAEGSDLPISFNSMSSDFSLGDTITAEETANKRSAKGTDYVQLRKVKKSQSAPALPVTVTSDYVEPGKAGEMNPFDFGTLMKELKEINAKIDKLLNMDTPDAEQEHAQRQAEIDARLMSDRPVTLDDLGGDQL